MESQHAYVSAVQAMLLHATQLATSPPRANSSTIQRNLGSEQEAKRQEKTGIIKGEKGIGWTKSDGRREAQDPIACAAALGAIETIEKENLIQRARDIEKILFTALRAIAAKHPEIGDIRGRGAMVAIELVKAGSKDPNPELMAKVIKYCQSKGVLILTAGSYGNVIRFLPPLVISDALLNDALTVLAEAFDVSA